MRTFVTTLVATLSVACASTAPSPTTTSRTTSSKTAAKSDASTAPTPVAIDFFAALKARDTARVESLLTANPELASARRKDGMSAVLVSLFWLDGEGFRPPQSNALLAAVMARRPPLDGFEAAAVGDVARVEAELARDPSFVRAFHAPPLDWTALHLAAFGGQPRVVTLLLDKGAPIDVRAKTEFDNTPLQVSMLSGQAAVAKLLVSRGADVNAKQAEGFTALHEAAQSGNVEVVTLLLDAGADVNAKSEKGLTPLDIAVKSRREEVTVLLKKRGAREGG